MARTREARPDARDLFEKRRYRDTRRRHDARRRIVARLRTPGFRFTDADLDDAVRQTLQGLIQ
jgi:hypothetical protein